MDAFDYDKIVLLYNLDVLVAIRILKHGQRGVCKDHLPLLGQRSLVSRRPSGTTNGNPHYELVKTMILFWSCRERN